MAILDTLSRRARSVVRDPRAAWATSPPDSNAGALNAFTGTAQETREMYDTIAARVAEARATAEARGEDFSIEHYRKACVAFGENTPEGQRMVAEGKWSPASYADLSGQDLHGIRLTNPKAIKPEHDLSPAIQADYDSFNRDGDGLINSPAINQFYDRVAFDSHKFDGVNGGAKTDLRGAIVDPSTSFNPEIAKVGGEGLTFNNMAEGDTFTFGAGHYKDVRMTNIRGGEIIFGDNSHVHGAYIEGVTASFTMGDHASASNIITNPEFRVMNLSMGKNSHLRHFDGRNMTLSQASEFGPGATLQDVQLGSNVSGVNFEGVTFKNVTFEKSRLSDTSFAGASLNGVSFTDVDVSQLDLSGVKSFNGVTVNGKTVTSAKDYEMQKLASGVKSFAYEPKKETANPNNSLAQSARNKEVADVNAANFGNDPIAAARAVALQLGIVGGASVNLSDVGLTTQVASLERTVPEHEQASGANMNRNLPGAKGDA